MNLIISGACGFLGANLTEHVVASRELANKYEKIILVDLLQYDVQNIPHKILDNPKIKFIKDSIYSDNIIKKILHNGDELIHLAVEENTFENPQNATTVNLEKYVSSVADAKPSKFIYISSADIYGINNSDNLTETAVLKPTTVYAANKMSFEGYVNAYSSLKGLPSVIFRPVTIYGPKQYPGWLIPRVITRIMNNEKIQITGDGSVKRDWIFVDDVCSLLTKALITTDKKIFGEVFNVGTGTEMSVLEVVRHVLEALGKDESELVEFIAPRPGDMPRQITKAEKAKRTFGWSPKVETKNGLTGTISWYKDNPA